jgi:hypothetical protein
MWQAESGGKWVSADVLRLFGLKIVTYPPHTWSCFVNLIHSLRKDITLDSATWSMQL